MSRRKHLAVRRPSGAISHKKSELLSPTEIRRLIEAASAGLRDVDLVQPAWPASPSQQDHERAVRRRQALGDTGRRLRRGLPVSASAPLSANSTPSAACLRILIAPPAFEKRAATSAPPRTTWTVAARCALPAARPSASSNSRLRCRIRRRRVFSELEALRTGTPVPVVMVARPAQGPARRDGRC